MTEAFAICLDACGKHAGLNMYHWSFLFLSRETAFKASRDRRTAPFHLRHERESRES